MSSSADLSNYCSFVGPHISNSVAHLFNHCKHFCKPSVGGRILEGQTRKHWLRLLLYLGNRVCVVELSGPGSCCTAQVGGRRPMWPLDSVRRHWCVGWGSDGRWRTVAALCTSSTFSPSCTVEVISDKKLKIKLQDPLTQIHINHIQLLTICPSPVKITGFGGRWT